MDIVTRNFFRLLASGVFGEHEAVEPMSAYKWRQLHLLAELHEVALLVQQGIDQHRDEFFMQLPVDLQSPWVQEGKESDEGVYDDNEEESNNDLLEPTRLTNPLLNHKLQRILNDEESTPESRQMMLMLSGIVRHLMNEGVPVKLLVELGLFLRQRGDRVDYIRLQEWLQSLRMGPMAQLIGAMLIRLFNFTAEEIPFLTDVPSADVDAVVEEIFELKSARSSDFRFSQGESIFVHTANSSAMFWHMRHSSRYFKYYPSETITNYFASFAHSLSHIEE